MGRHSRMGEEETMTARTSDVHKLVPSGAPSGSGETATKEATFSREQEFLSLIGWRIGAIVPLLLFNTDRGILCAGKGGMSRQSWIWAAAYLIASGTAY